MIAAKATYIPCKGRVPSGWSILTDQGRRESGSSRMSGVKLQGESRVRENFTHGLVYEVKPSLLPLAPKRGFTLIERVPRITHAETRWLERITPVNCSLQTGSLTAEHECARSAVTKPPEGNFLVGLPASREGLVVSPSGEAKSQAVGKRTSASIVKVIWRGLLTEPGIFGSRSPVLWEKAAIIGVASGQEHSMTRRCKRRRHVTRVSRSNWGDPARFPLGDGIRDGIRRNAEIRSDAVLGVGDGHSTEDRRAAKPAGREGPLAWRRLVGRKGPG